MGWEPSWMGVLNGSTILFEFAEVAIDTDFGVSQYPSAIARFSVSREVKTEAVGGIRDESLDAKYRDMLPYLHPRAFSRLTAKPFFMMDDRELEETRQAQLKHEEQVALGRGHFHLIKGPK